MRRVLLATDASEASLRAARFVGDLARLDPDLFVTVLHVVPIPDTLTPAAAVGAPLTLPTHLDDYVETHMREVLEQTRKAMGLSDEQIKLAHEVGLAGETILAFAREGNYDCIVMGRRGLSPLRELFVGSVSQAVLHRAHVPVILVP